MKKWLLLGICVFITSFAFASSCSPKGVAAQQNLLQNFARQALEPATPPQYLTAISIVTQRGDAAPILVYAGVNGLDNPVAVNSNSLFEIGSITKSFIAVVILQLSAEDGFSLDDPTLLAKYFPEYPKWHGITLRQLMNMTSGIPGNETRSANDIYEKFTAKEYINYTSPTQILNLTYALPLDFKPGTSFEYSNTNYTLLGEFILRLTHQSAEAQVNTRIIKKLGLHHTYFPINTMREFPEVPTDEIVHGYSSPGNDPPYPFMHFGEDITYFSLSKFNTAGAIVSTPSDINRYVHALFTPGVLLTSNQFTELTTLVSMADGKPFNPKTDLNDPRGYGLGIIGYYWAANHRLIYLYNGTTDGFNFVYLYDPQTKQYLTLAVNSLAHQLVTIDNMLALFANLNAACEAENKS